MKSRLKKLVSFSNIRIALLVAMVVSGLTAQTPDRPHQRIGLPQDWTHQHIVFSRDVWRQHPDLAREEPRVVHQLLQRNVRLLAANIASSLSSTESHTTSFQRDWNVSLNNPGRIAAGMSPAKYSFDTTAPPSCTGDYVVFALNAPGSGTQANLIAFNQLYSGTGGLCGTGGPSVLFAYNIGGGRIATSPIISLDGTKIAFVESSGTASIFHVLTWATGPGNGTSASAPAVPGVGNTASMVSITYANTGDTRSSPWIDYKNDTVYVGANNGRVSKITGVFTGAPTLVTTAPWPVGISPGRIISGPVLDQVTQRLFVGDTAGRLRSFDSITGGSISSLAVGTQGATGGQVVDSPMVDSSNGLVYAVSGNDSTSAVVVQADAGTLQEISRGRIGRGGTGGANITIYDGAFDDNYFNSVSTGTLRVCGTSPTDTSPWLYTFNFTGTALNPVATTQVPILVSTRARCSPITEFFNPNVNGGTDFFFFGLTLDCFGPFTVGCITAQQTAGVPPLPVRESGGTSAIVIDNQSTAGQASSIYFTDLNAPGRAVKLTQNGLQ